MLRGGTVSGPPRRTTTVALSPCKHHSATDSPWGPYPPAPGSWEQTWQRVCPNWSGSPGETQEKVLVRPLPPARLLPQGLPEVGGHPAGSHTSAGHATLRFLSCWRPLQSPLLPTTCPQHPQDPGIQLWKPDPQQFSNKCSSLAELRRTFLSQARLSW